METSNRVLDAVLKEFNLPHVEEQVPRDVFYKLGLKFPQQYAIAARDIASCVRRAEALGAGPFLHVKPESVSHKSCRPVAALLRWPCFR